MSLQDYIAQEKKELAVQMSAPLLLAKIRIMALERGAAIKTFLLIGVMFLTTGCNKKLFGVDGGGTTYQNKTVVLMGQSNALYFSQYGGTQAFAKDIQHFAPGQLTYIQCAVGGTDLEGHWMPGKDLYQACLKKIDGKHIDLILWDQGEYEAETWDPEIVDQWAADFTMMVNSLRASLHNPSLPILYCRLGDADQGIPLLKPMRNQQESVHISNARMVNLDGIPTEGLHYVVNNGYIGVARRYANAYYDLLNERN